MLRILNGDEFRAHCKHHAATLKATYYGIEYRRGPSFAMSLYQKAIDFSERHLAQDSECLLIKEEMHCTVWIPL